MGIITTAVRPDIAGLLWREAVRTKRPAAPPQHAVANDGRADRDPSIEVHIEAP